MRYLIGYGVLFIITAVGIVDVIYQICTFIKWLRSPRVQAIIVDVRSQIWNYGLIRFQYQFCYCGQVYTLWGSWFETFNPFLCNFPRLSLGRTVTIRIDEKKIKVVSWYFASWIMLIIGLMIAVLGILSIIIILDTGNKKKSPSPSKEYLNFLHDEGDHIIIFTFLLFHADRHAGLKPELQIVIVHSHFFEQISKKTSLSFHCIFVIFASSIKLLLS